MGRTRSICLVAALLGAAGSRAQGLDAPTRGVVPPARSMALEDEATAMTGNPAGAAFSGGWQLEYVRNASYRSGHGSGDGLFLGAALGPAAVGFAREWMHEVFCSASTPCKRRTTFGLALRAGAFALGANLHSLSTSDNPEVDNTRSLDLGLLARPTRWLSLALVTEDVNRPSIGVDQPRRWTAAVGFRPLGERLDLAFDYRFRECVGLPGPCGADHFDSFATVQARLIPGLTLVAQAGLLDRASTFSVQTGIQLDRSNVGVRYAPQYGDGADARYAMRVRLSSQEWPSLRSPARRALLLDLAKSLQPPKASLVDLVFPQSHEDPLARTLAALRRLESDRTAAAIVLKGADLGIGNAKVEEIRAAIERLQAAGKKVLFYLESGGDLEYSLALQADRIYVPPQAVLSVNGFSATALFAGAGLEKLGVKAEFFRVGAYKNAPDIFTRSEMSGEQREVQNAILDDLYGPYVRRIAARRHLDAEKVKALLDRGLLSPQETVKEGLVDGLLYPDQLEEETGKVLGAKAGLERLALDEPDRRNERWGSPPKVVVVRVEGNILRGEGGSDPFGTVRIAGSGPIARKIRQAADDPGVAAIVVRIDSPGGDGNASDLIWRELVRARKEKKKPVVASMGDVAASGGYYVAAGADEIFAEPQTITGSIGVFAGHFNLHELYSGLGLNLTTVKRGESADLFSTARPLTDKERAMFQGWVEGFYSTFLDRVAEGRKLDKAEVDKVARGRVWTGAQALERKLVDRLGGLDDAIASARQRAGVDDAEVIDQVSPQVGLSDLAMAGTLTSLPLFSSWARAARAAAIVGEPGTLRAILPYDLEVH